MRPILGSDSSEKQDVDRGEQGGEQTVPVINCNNTEAGQHTKSVSSRRPRGTNTPSSSLSPSKSKKVSKLKQRKQKKLLLTMKEKQTEDTDYWNKIKNSDDRKERREKMKLCFARNNVEMQVKQEDILIDTDEAGDCDDMADGVLVLPRSKVMTRIMTVSTAEEVPPENQESLPSSASKKASGNDDSKESGHQTLEPPITATTATFSTVPNCCVICLDQYKVGDTVVWSSGDNNCPHAFHRTCIIKYLDKIHKRVGRTPCPCCRQEFTDLQVEARRKKKGIALLLHQLRRQFRSSTSTQSHLSNPSESRRLTMART